MAKMYMEMDGNHQGSQIPNVLDILVFFIQYIHDLHTLIFFWGLLLWTTFCSRVVCLCLLQSMVKKSKSVIMTAKDIPMNAFMAMKSGASEKVTCELPAKKGLSRNNLNVAGREVAPGLSFRVCRRGDPMGMLQGTDHHEGRIPSKAHFSAAKFSFKVISLNIITY